MTNAAQPASATLFSPNNATLEDLRNQPAPQKLSDRHHPIAHADVCDLVSNSLAGHGLAVTNTRITLDVLNDETKAYDRAFGVFDIKATDGSDVGFVAGFANSIDRSISARVLFGSRVFVCSNLCFAGDIHLRRRHTIGIEKDLPQMIDNAVDRYAAYQISQEKLFDRLRDEKINTDTAWGIIGETFRNGNGRGMQSKSRIADIMDVYEGDLNKGMHGHGTAWALYNAGTEFAKSRQSSHLFDSSGETMNWHRTFARRYGKDIAITQAEAVG